ncbi:MAG: 30S ribosomal protein S5 [Planctomycetes bacterium]|nr:30S ribosomal protein S5 [Planctomycetota bacterium]MCB9905683.1 30S ribosomal protein S5 [Planctomycetota bacterium]
MKRKFEYLDSVEVDELGELTEALVKVNRSAAVVKGGRRFSFSALSVVGNRKGVVGCGFGKARQVPNAIEKAAKDGRKHLQRVPVTEGGAIPHEVTGRFCGSMIRLLPASPGTGIIACSSVRAVCEMAGISNILTKSYGSTNPMNLIKATLDALAQLRTREQVKELRGTELGS